MPAAAPVPVSPTARPRRTPLWRHLLDRGALFVDGGDTAIAWLIGSAAGDAARLRQLAFADLTPLPRSGFKGRDALAWLAEQGTAGEAAANRAYRQADGTLLVKLAATEALLLPAVAPDAAAPLADRVPPADRMAFPVPRRDASLWFRLAGLAAPEMLAKLCAVDLRPSRFPDGSVAQTSLARMNAILVRDDLRHAGDVITAYHLIADIASAEYLWECLADAAAEYGGGPVGLAVLMPPARPD